MPRHQRTPPYGGIFCATIWHMFSITFVGGTGSVTGACFLYDSGTQKFLIDCGLAQGSEFAEQANYEPFSFNPADMSVLIVTHAHADHIGRIPKLVKDGFKGVIYSTPATRALAEVMYPDALSILAQEARMHGHEPLYAQNDVDQTLSLWRTHEYHEAFDIGDTIQVQFKDAGHILGSAMVQLTRNNKVYVHTGDLGNSPAPLLCDTESIEGTHFLLTESVYGDRNHEERGERTNALRDILRETFEYNRTLLIPTFAIDRTQVLLYLINNLVESGEVPAIPVYLDAPLAQKATAVYAQYSSLFNDTAQAHIKNGDDIFNFPEFVQVLTAHDSETLLKKPAPKVILAGSGMSVGGRVVSHEAQLLKDKNTTVLFVGYQGVGTLGRRIQDGNKSVKVGDEWVRVHAHVATINGFSAHKDRDGLLDFVAHAADTLQKVFVVMGETKSSLFLTQRLRDFLNVNAVAPEEGQTLSIDF